MTKKIKKPFSLKMHYSKVMAEFGFRLTVVFTGTRKVGFISMTQSSKLVEKAIGRRLNTSWNRVKSWPGVFLNLSWPLVSHLCMCDCM